MAGRALAWKEILEIWAYVPAYHLYSRHRFDSFERKYDPQVGQSGCYADKPIGTRMRDS